MFIKEPAWVVHLHIATAPPDKFQPGNAIAASESERKKLFRHYRWLGPLVCQALKDTLGELPERLNCPDVDALIRRVRSLDGWAEGHRVHAGELGAKDPTL